MTARIMHHLMIIRRMQHRMRGHRSGVTNTLCGLPPPGGDVCTIPLELEQLPSYGSRLTYSLKEQTLTLPHVALPYKVREADRTVVMPGQSAGFLARPMSRSILKGTRAHPISISRP